jgi:GTP cyclohydrolase I
MPADTELASRKLAEALTALGVEPCGPNLAETPARVAALWAELFSGLDAKNAPDLEGFPNPDPTSGPVIVRGLPFHALCAHHLLPFFGRAHVAYLPADRVVGLGSIARLIDHHARRPTLQEDVTAGIADDLAKALAPRGVGVVLEARHLCMEMRGARRSGRVETSVWRGELDEPARRTEILLRLRSARRRPA